MPDRDRRLSGAAKRGTLLALAVLLAGAAAPAGRPPELAASASLPGRISDATPRAATRTAAPSKESATGSSYATAPKITFAYGEGGGPKWTDITMAVAAGGSFFLTLVLAWSTVLLWRETKRLAVSADDQHDTLKASVEVAARSAKVAEDALILSNRPWIPDDLRLVSGARIGAHGLDIKIRVTLKNIGNSPAYNVDPNLKLVWTEDAGAEQAKISERLPMPINQGRYGITIFPGDPEIAYDSNISIPRSDLEKHRENQAGTLFVPLSVVGAISYRGINHQLHETGVAYTLNRLSAQAPGFGLMIDMDGGDVGLAELQLRRDILWQPKTT